MKENIQEILEKYELKNGSHESLEKGACIMELVSYIANEPWSDHPKCACPVLTAYAIRLNDRFNHEDRQKLKPLIPKLLNTRDETKQKTRAHFLILQSITVFLPILTDALELTEISAKLRMFKAGEWLAARDFIQSSRPAIKEAASKRAAAAWGSEAAVDAWLASFKVGAE